jgi:hypothetical protein
MLNLKTYSGFDDFTNIRQSMLKLKTHSGFHDLFLKSSQYVLLDLLFNVKSIVFSLDSGREQVYKQSTV